MDNDKFLRWREQFLEEAFTLGDMKSIDYTVGSNDRHRNFKAIAARSGLDPIEVLWVYMLKHIDSLESYVRTKTEGSEPVRGRAMDLLNYIILFAALVDEDKELPDEG